MNVSTDDRPEDRARANMDRLLTAARMAHPKSRQHQYIEAGRGIAIRESSCSRVWFRGLPPVRR